MQNRFVSAFFYTGMAKKNIFILLLFVLVAVGCKDYTPKPRGYNRIDIQTDRRAEYLCFPEFSFEYSGAAKIDTLKSPNKGERWFNIVYPEYDAVIHCTYLPVTSTTLPKALEDSYHLAYSHSLKADGINQRLFNDRDKKVSGILYEIGGQVATPVQFFVTDSVRHFLRGSFYYSGKVNTDSVAPVTEYIINDIGRMMGSISWKGK